MKGRNRGHLAVSLAIVLSFVSLGSTSLAETSIQAESTLHYLDSALDRLSSLTRTTGFIENAGQLSNEDVLFYTASGDIQMAFLRSAVLIKKTEYWPVSIPSAMDSSVTHSLLPMSTSAKAVLIRVTFDGANMVTPRGRNPLSHPSHFFIGGDPAHWRTNVRSYSEIVYEGLYGGVDLVYHTTEQGVKYDFILDPGREPRTIAMTYDGLDGVEMDPTGSMLVHTAVGDIVDSAPIARQGVDVIPCTFALRGKFSYGFECEGLDNSRVTVIDPLIYSTYLGGGNWDRVRSIAVDSAGAVYVAGETVSTDFPVTPGAFDTTRDGTYDAFVAKLDSDGSSLLYSTYLGGSGDDYGWSIAVDSSGDAFVAGDTLSTDFPTTPGAYDTFYNGGSDAFVVKLGPMGSSLLYATFVGGTTHDWARSIAVSATGDVYATGYTLSADFPVTPGAFNTIYSGNCDVWSAKLDSTGSSLIYSTFLGGGGDDFGQSIAVDSSGITFLAGHTLSGDFPTTPGSLDTTYNGSQDAFVAKLDSTGSSLLYSTYLGGGDVDYGWSVAVDSTGNAYVAGTTFSADFYVTAGAYNTTRAGVSDAFIAKLDSTGSSLLYSTYLGGRNQDDAASITVDSGNSVFVTGSTQSSDFPVTPSGFDTTYNGGGSDAYVARLDSAGNTLLYSSFLGGSAGDYGLSVVLDTNGDAYIAGNTFSTDFQTTPGAYDTTSSGTSDGFTAKVNVTVSNSPPIASGPGVQGFTDPPDILHVADATPDLNWTYGDPDGDPEARFDLRVGTFPGAADMWNPPASPGPATSITYAGPSLDRGSTYYLGLKVYDGTAWSAEVEVAFHMNSIPNPPSMPVSPLNRSLIPLSATQTVTWNNGSDAESDAITYEWQVDDESAFMSPLLAYGTATTRTSAQFATSAGTTYYWRVRARDDWESATWSAYGNIPPGYWMFTASLPPNTHPTVSLTSPAGGEIWYHATSHAVNWIASDNEDATSALLVWVNYTSSAGDGGVCGPVPGSVGQCNWIVPNIVASDVVVNVTVIDMGMLRGFDDSGQFTIRAPPVINTPPTVVLMSPIGGEHWLKGSSHMIVWSMQDSEDLDADLTVYVNYSTGGVTTPIVAGLKGQESFQWTLPDIEATDVYVNITVIDTGELKGWAQNGPFEIKVPTSPPSAETNYKTLVAAVFAIILLTAGLWSSKKRPWKSGKDGKAMVKAFMLTSMPFVLAEAATGVVSFLTGQLSIPPLVGVGTAVDLAILLAGIVVAILRIVRNTPSEAEEAGTTQKR